MARAVLVALFFAACATTSEGEQVPETYESKAEVMAAEARREAKAFDDRLARLRKEEEERQLARIDRIDRIESSSVSDDRSEEEPLPEELEDLAGAGLESPGNLEVGSSARALEKLKSESRAAGVAPPPTPESYLRGARCVISSDLANLRKAFEEGKRAGREAQNGPIAVVIIESEGLVRLIDEEMKHRRLPLTDGECKEHREVVELLRSLVGPRVDERGLRRLTEELEVRAGLPKTE